MARRLPRPRLLPAGAEPDAAVKRNRPPATARRTSRVRRCFQGVCSDFNRTPPPRLAQRPGLVGAQVVEKVARRLIPVGGIFSRHRKTIFARGARNRPRLRVLAGSSRSTAPSVSTADSESKARAPVNISKKTAPREKTSLRASAPFPRTRSGEM